jgi:hypothetical protein
MTDRGKCFNAPDRIVEIETIPPNPDRLVIVRLFLEKLESLTTEERAEMLAVIRSMNNPLLKAMVA